MGTKNGWFRLMKKMLLRSRKDEAEKKKKWKWFSGGVKARRFGAIKASSPPAKASEELAVATVSQDHRDLSVGDERKTRKEDPRTQIQDSAAIIIQTSFRGYLARKALRALKGIVKLQAIIRGRAVRRQAINTLKCLQSIVNIQSQLRQTRLDAAAQGIWTTCQPHNLRLFSHNLTTITMDSNSPRRWDDSLLSKQDVETLFLSKKDAMMRRERIKGYASIHRRSEETERNNAKGRWRYWLDQWVDTQLSKSREVEDLDSIFRSKEQIKLKQIMRQSSNEDLDSPTSLRRRKCHHRKQYSMGDSFSFAGSPVVPAYMAATESAKAKARAGGSPKQRQWSFDAYSDSYSPCKNKLSVLASEDPTTGRPGRIQERSSSFKGVQGPVKSSRIVNDLSIDSAYALPFWDRT